MDVLEQPLKVLEEFAAGEPQAFEKLFRQFQGEVYGWIVRIVRDAGVAEELTLETFLKIHRAHARFDPERSFEAWARRIATNVALDHLKKPQSRNERQGTSEEAELVLNLAAGPVFDPGVQREIRERTRLAFQQLPAKLRVVATLALIEERPQGEIADALNISTAAVKSRMFRAIRMLRLKLKDLGWHHE